MTRNLKSGLLPWGFNAGWYLRHESGDTWAARIRVPNDVPGNVFDRIIGEPAGSRQLPSHTLMDLRFEKEFPLYRGQLRMTMDVFNFFNAAPALGADETFGSETFGQVLRFGEPRQIRLGVRYIF